MKLIAKMLFLLSFFSNFLILSEAYATGIPYLNYRIQELVAEDGTGTVGRTFEGVIEAKPYKWWPTDYMISSHYWTGFGSNQLVYDSGHLVEPGVFSIDVDAFFCTDYRRIEAPNFSYGCNPSNVIRGFITNSGNNPIDVILTAWTPINGGPYGASELWLESSVIDPDRDGVQLKDLTVSSSMNSGDVKLGVDAGPFNCSWSTWHEDMNLPCNGGWLYGFMNYPQSIDLTLSLAFQLSPHDKAIITSSLVLSPIPEPTTLSLFAIGALGILTKRRRTLSGVCLISK